MTERIQPSSVRLADGRWRHVIRQSWLGTFEMCPELARRELFGELPPKQLSDSLIGGTVIHAAIESLIGVTMNGIEPSLDEALAAYDTLFDVYLESAGGNEAIRWEKRKERGTRQYGRRSLTTFYEHILPVLQPVGVEVEFGPLVLHEDDKRIIEVRGILDYIDERGPWDWKSSSRSNGFEPWEKERWNKQATLYTWAMSQVPELAEYPHDWFRFCVFLPGGEAQLVDVTRGEGDWSWIVEQALSICTLIEAELPVWPLNDAGWHCGSKWCPAWADCKGKHVGLDAW